MLTKSLILVLAFVALANCDGRLIYRLYSGSINNFVEYNFINFHTIIHDLNFVRSRETVVFHYGIEQTPATPQISDVISSYIGRNTYNFILIHYADLETINTDNANGLAAGIRDNMITFFNQGYSSGLMNFLGFGLGAQIMARASRQIQTQSGRLHVIRRLTGLDPWGLGPINSITIGTLSAADAQWVESVHTEGNQRGDLDSNGHVWFYVNSGVAQPMCNQVSPIARWDCSHVFALTIWAESVRSISPLFPALQCSSWELFISGACNTHDTAHMGRTTENNLRGAYMLQTNMAAPFSRNTPQPSFV